MLRDVIIYEGLSVWDLYFLSRVYKPKPSNTKYYDFYAFFTCTEQFIRDYQFLHNPHSQNKCGCWAYLEDDTMNGYRVCTGCGRMFEDAVDLTEEWNSFEDSTKIRCGMAGNVLSTQLGKCRDPRLMQYHISTNMPYRDKAILEKCKEFDQLGNQLNINDGVIHAAKEYYKLVYENIKTDDGEKKSHRGKPLVGNIAACVWIAAIEHHFPLVKEFLLDYLKLEETYLRVALNNIHHLEYLFYNTRHIGIPIIATFNVCMDVPPKLRANVDYVIALPNNDRRKLYEHYFGRCGILDYDTFEEWMNNYGTLICDIYNSNVYYDSSNT